MKNVIYNGDTGILSIILPAPSWNGTIDELARYAVPTGKKYKIIDNTEIPTDDTFRDAWEVDEAELTDGVGA